MARLSGYRVSGLYQVIGALTAIGVEVEDLKDAFSAISDRGARVAASLAPRRSGTLAGDIRGNRAKSKAVVSAGRTRVPYAGPINYGWAAHNIAANGFMQRTDQVMRPYAISQLENNINAVIRRKGLR